MWLAVIIFVCLSVEVLSYLSDGSRKTEDKKTDKIGRIRIEKCDRRTPEAA